MPYFMINVMSSSSCRNLLFMLLKGSLIGSILCIKLSMGSRKVHVLGLEVQLPPLAFGVTPCTVDTTIIQKDM